MEIIAGLAFLALLVIGLAGWGSLVLAVDPALRPYRDRLGLGAATGLCLYLAAAILFETRVVQSTAIVTPILVVGAAFWCVRRARGERWVRWHWSLAVPLAVALALAANSATWQFANTDDLQGYLVYVERVVRTGSTGHDPFTYRRFESGLGGGSYLYALGTILGDTARLRIVDIGGGLAMLAALIAGDLRGARPAVLAGVLCVLVAVVAFTPSVNMTPEIVGMAMVYAMARVCQIVVDSTNRVSRAAIVGLFAFALVCLKTTFVVPVGCFALATYATVLWRDRRWQTVAEAIAAGLVALLLMSPWMAISRAAVGTPLFPLLGVGRLSPLEAGGHASLANLVKSGGRIALLLVLPLWVAVRSARRPVTAQALFVAIAVPLCVALFLLAQVKYTVAGYRYGYAAAAALFLFSLAIGARSGAGRMERLAALVLAPLLLADIALYVVLTPGYGADTFTGGGLYRTLIAGQAVPPVAAAAGARAETQRLQGAIPSGAVLLARVDRPYHLDFARNRVWVMDWPGLMGPQPIPASGDPVVWARYWRRSGVDFVAWSYADEAGMPAAYLADQIARNDSAFLREQLGRTMQVQGVLERLRRAGPVIFDDGRSAVIDLRGM